MGEQKSIFVTGAGSGIGRATAQLFAERGWFVGLFDVNPEGLQETAASLPEGQRISMVFDVRDRSVSLYVPLARDDVHWPMAARAC